MNIIAIMAGFSFGYCIMDIFRNIQAERRINEILKETVLERDYD